MNLPVDCLSADVTEVELVVPVVIVKGHHIDKVLMYQAVDGGVHRHIPHVILIREDYPRFRLIKTEIEIIMFCVIRTGHFVKNYGNAPILRLRTSFFESSLLKSYSIFPKILKMETQQTLNNSPFNIGRLPS